MVDKQHISVVFLIVLYASCSANALVQRFCQPFTDSSSVPLPKLPDNFQSHVEATIKNSMTTKTIKAIEYYSRDMNIGSVIVTDNNVRAQIINDYSQNLAFNVVGNECITAKLNESQNSGFFSIHLNGDGTETIGTPSEIFHFNNGYGTKYIGAEVVRGIPVNHFQSCQDWSLLQANVLVDYYFAVKGYNSSSPSTDIPEIPVMATVQGIAFIDDDNNVFVNVSNTYNYYDFKPFIVDYDYAFNTPSSVYCAGTPFSPDIPKLKNNYHYTEETVLPNGQVFVSKIFYDYNYQTVRIDTRYSLKLPAPFNQDPVTIVHDFNSGVGYIYDRFTRNCTKISLGEDLFDIDVDTGYTIQQLQQQMGYSVRMRDPQKFLYLDDTYYFAGTRKIRGIDCNSFKSNRTDYLVPSLGNINYTIFEWCFLARDWYDESSGEAEGGIPIALNIYLPELGLTIRNNIYDFDQSTIPIKRFDVSDCYSNREKSEFAITFGYTGGVDEISFKEIFSNLAEGFFIIPLISSLSEYNLSPLRIIPPKTLVFEDRFTILSGITDYPPPILQFTKFGTSKIDLDKARFVAPASSPENCAFICINATRLHNDKFDCLSFDWCKNTDGSKGGKCSFYNASHLTDESLFIETDNTCDHYSKNTDRFDSLPRDFAIKQINNAVITKQFNISITTADNIVVISFPANDITEGVFQGNVLGGGDGGNFGGGFTREFKVYPVPSVYNENSMSLNTTIFLRKRTLISANECARLCIAEGSFFCESYTYDYKNYECKWSNVQGDPDLDVSTNAYLIAMNASTTAWYIRDAIFHYIRFPFSVTQEKDSKVIKDVATETQCAKFCDKESTFSCKSFNYCKSLKQCLLSKNHIHNPDKDPNVVPNPICVHYSKRSLNDFELVPQTEIVNLKPMTKIYNVSVETCAVLCEYEDTYLCRSFTHYIDTNNCFMYKENLADKIYFDIKVNTNPKSNHYSRLYYTLNGNTYTITASGGKTKGKKYTGGAIFGVLLALIIGFLTLGFLVGYTYSKVKNGKSPAFDAKLKFTNPNFSKKTVE